MKIGIIIGSIRNGRVGPQVADYVKKIADLRTEHAFELIDIKDYHLPFLGTDQGNPDWNAKINALDGYIFITSENNHSLAASLKNAIDHARGEWFNKAAAIVSYGSSGGVRAAEHLRQIMGEQYVAMVRTNPAYNLFTDFIDMTTFKPALGPENLNAMLDELLLWSKGLASIR